MRNYKRIGYDPKMPRSADTETPHYSDSQRQTAEYIADLLLGLRKTAKRTDLTFLVHLLEMAFYEAYTVAKQAEPDMAAIDRLSQASDTN
jgi:hypothetical protein